MNDKHYILKDGTNSLESIRKLVNSDEGWRGFLVANIFKYVTRYKKKGGLKDLHKAEDYLNKLIDFEWSLQRKEIKLTKPIESER